LQQKIITVYKHRVLEYNQHCLCHRCNQSCMCESGYLLMRMIQI